MNILDGLEISLKNTRKRYVMVLSGAEGTGKTEEAKRIISQYDGDVLIIDSCNEYRIINNKRVSKTTTDKIQQKGIKRIVPTIPFSQAVIENIIHKSLEFRHGLLVIDNIFENSRVLDMLVSTHKTRDVDVIIITQAQRIHPMLQQNADYIKLFSHVQHPAITYFLDDVFAIASSIITRKHNNGNRYHNLTISLEDLKISGEYSNEDYLFACIEYLSKDINKLKKITDFFSARSVVNKKMKHLLKYKS